MCCRLCPQALDLLLDKMKGAGLDFSRVAALSGSGQVRLLITTQTGPSFSCRMVESLVWEG